MEPTTSGRSGLELVTILEAATASLKANGAPVNFLRKRDVDVVSPRPSQSRGAVQVGPLTV
jgi:hypothetical protein